MRILQIRLKNLNSLAGEWHIDLTDPAYTANGLFAITGPTGAGKSTLLDALCLALYGRTPRLARIGKNGNELMTRRTGECFAEAVFETSAGQFRCHWSQHRARRRADGELQNPKHEIARADTQELLETSLRGVAEQVETATGMDFERFTRSMLLAQGGFAAFLQASPDQRSPLLEQITGTAIYSRISMHVHERHSAEHKRLELLRATLAGLQPLSDEAEQQLQRQLAEHQTGEATLTQRLAQHQQAIEWLEHLARLHSELQQLTQTQAALTERSTAFAPAQARLDAAQRALELAAPHSTLSALREAQLRELTAQRSLQDQRPAIETAQTQTQALWQQAQTQAEQAQAALQAARPQLQRARELDWHIAEQQRSIAALQTERQQQSQALHTLRTAHAQDLAALAHTEAAQHALQTQLQASQADAALVPQLTGLQARLQALAQAHQNLHALQQQTAQTAQQLRQAQADHQSRHAAQQQRQQALAQHQQTLAGQQADRQRLLQQRPLSEWRQRHAQLQEQRSLLQRASDALQTRQQARSASHALTQRQTGLAAQQHTLQQQQAQLRLQLQAMATELDLLETQLMLLQRIESLEEARHTLRDGEPCPLCGALEHPFAQNPLPSGQAEHTRTRLAQLRCERDALQQQLSQTQIQHATTARDRQQLSAEHARLADTIASAWPPIEQACTQLDIAPAAPQTADDTAADSALATALATALKARQEHTLHTEQLLAQADTLEHAIAQLRQQTEASQTALHQAEHDTQAAQYHLAQIQHELQRLEQQAAQHAAHIEQAQATLRGELQAYGIDAPGVCRTWGADSANPPQPSQWQPDQQPGTPNSDRLLEQIDNTLQHLTQRRDTWLARQQQQRELAERQQALQQQTRHQGERIEQLNQRLAELAQRQHSLEQALTLQHSERQQLLSGRSANEEETRLQTQLQQAQHALEQARAQRDAAAQWQTQWQTQLHALDHSLHARQPALQAAEAAFAAALPAQGFSDETHWQAARLPEPERAQLAAQARQLQQAHTELATRLQDTRRQLETQQARQLTTTDPQTLHASRDTLAAELRELLQTIGALRTQLSDNAQRKQQQHTQLQAIEAQQQECLRWQQLHALIGSADGKKYRNFAQGLTFETVVRHANRQLQRMSDRYLLGHDATQPLELHVIDHYQAGEIRSTKNLSGGESFLVSLALALGLSHMASQNVRVDSLFIDEGFGALDEDALDTALDALASLQQQGKLIGVISHVAALKERIPTQIQVVPGSGGKSQLAGPGCSTPSAPSR